MKQYSEIELSDKIQAFMSVKMKQYPELYYIDLDTKSKATKTRQVPLLRLWMPLGMRAQY